ncbi:hypothetical protein WJX81_004629 [Elliptochloris bilobata]|uniref:Nodulin-like domain-containing protein n=1 Tax=Elliptochloris bilobata TaxID=381761 RepID=A0AAW1RRX1_9CHLO
MAPKYVSKYFTFTASAICQLSAGLAYCFSLYSDALKTHFGYSQQQIEGVGSACNLGGYLSLPSGLFYDWLASRGHNHLGPRLTMGIGAACNILGYLALWAGASGRVDLAYWQVVASTVLACNSGAWVDAACLVTSTRNFPGERGTVIGILKSTLGLSASIWTALYVGLFQPHAIDFLLFLAFAPAVLTLVGLFFINFVPFVQANESLAPKRFMTAIQVLLALGVYQMATAIMEQSASLALGPRARQVITLGTLLLVSATALVPWGTGGLWAVPAGELSPRDAAAPDEAAAEEAARLRREGQEVADGEAERPLLREADSTAEQGKGQGKCAEAEPEPDLTPLQCLRCLDFWLLFFACTIGMGSGLVLLNNLGQLVAALGGTQGPAVYVSLFSIMNCAGRIAFGYIPERMLHERGTPRPLFLVGAGLGTAAIAALAAFADLRALYPITILAGAAFGAHWSLMPALTSELFGLRHFASNYSLVQFAPAVGSFGMATKLAGYLYDREAGVEAEEEGEERTCIGVHCYRAAFLSRAIIPSPEAGRGRLKGGIAQQAGSPPSQARKMNGHSAEHRAQLGESRAGSPPDIEAPRVRANQSGCLDLLKERVQALSLPTWDQISRALALLMWLLVYPVWRPIRVFFRTYTLGNAEG